MKGLEACESFELMSLSTLMALAAHSLAKMNLDASCFKSISENISSMTDTLL
jgi:hypothetical protein